MASALPVLTYYGVTSSDGHGLPLFEAHLRALRRSGLSCLPLPEFPTAAAGYLLTFDDGFADLWTDLFELIHAYELYAVVFVITGFVGEGPTRARGTASWPGSSTSAFREAAPAGSPHPAFLRWAELAALEASGRVFVQSDSHSHRMGWTGDRIGGFHLETDPATGTRWSLVQATGGDMPLGIPTYARGSALSHRLCFDSPGLRDALVTWLDRRGASALVKELDGRRIAGELQRQVSEYEQRHPYDRGRWETDAQRQARTVEELVTAREGLERRLGDRRDELALPWGQYDAVTLECARLAGVRRLYTQDRAPNTAARIGPVVHRFRARRRGAEWVRRRLWLYRSSLRTRIFAMASKRAPRDVAMPAESR